jgi:Bacterial protein of unknown function (DUF899)
VTADESDFSFDFGGSSSNEATRAWVEPMADQLPPIAARNAEACGVDLVTYLSEGFAFLALARSGDSMFLTYSPEGRGVEFLMSYYPILDRVPRGRDEGEALPNLASPPRRIPDGFRRRRRASLDTRSEPDRSGSPARLAPPLGNGECRFSRNAATR